MTQREGDDRTSDLLEAFESDSYSVDALLVADAMLARWSPEALAQEWIAMAGGHPPGEAAKGRSSR